MACSTNKHDVSKEKQSVQNETDSKMKKSKFKPISIELKSAIDNKMSLEEIEKTLGPYHEAYGFGVSYLVWYFEDDLTLIIVYFGSVNEKSKKIMWLKCKPGEFDISMIRMM